MRRIRLIILMVMMLAAAGKPVHAQVNAEQVTSIGRNVLSMDDYMLAIHYFNQAIKAKDYLPEPYFLRALAKMHLEDFQGAEADCSKAIEIKKFFSDAYRLRGYCRLQLNKFDLALEDLDKCLEENPKDKEMLYYKAVSQAELKRYDESDSTFTVLIDANPNFYEAITSRAGMRFQRGDTIGCLEDIERTLALSKSQEYPNGLKAEIMQRRCDWPGAIDAITEIIKFHPDNTDLYLNRAFFRYKNDDYYGAMADYNEAINMDPYNTAALFNRGLLRYEVMELDKAAADFGRVIDLDKSNFHALFNRALIYLSQKKYAKAEPDVRAIIKRFPKYYPAYYALAQCRQARGDTKGAIQNMMIADDMVRKYVANPKKNPLDRPTVAPVANDKKKKQDPEETEEDMMDKFNQLVTASVTEDKQLSFNDRYKGKVQDRESSLAPQPMFVLSMIAPDETLKVMSTYFKELGDLNSHNYISERIYLAEDGRQLSPQDIEKVFQLADKYTVAILSNHQRAIDYLGRGIAYTMLRNYEAALEDFDKALQLMPDFTVAMIGKAFVMGKITEDGKKPNPASIIEVYDKVLQQDPLLIYAWFNEGNLYYENGNYSRAEECYDKAIKLYPELGQAYYNRGLCRMQTGRKEAAFEDFSKAGEQGVTQGYRVMKSLQSK